MDAAAYRDQLVALQPPGAALPAAPGSTWVELLAAMADEFARVDGRVGALVAESDPRSANELLDDLERAYGLPDGCTPAAPTLSGRRAALHARVSGVGGQSRAYFIAVAAALGYTVAIAEYPVHTVGADVNAPLSGADWAYAWRVDAGAVLAIPLDVTASVDESLLAVLGNADMECVIRALKPAHTIVLFAYS